MKTYSLEFNVLALKEWQKLVNSIRSQFKKQLEKRLQNPKIASAKLHGDLNDFYKIKLSAVGHRLVYQVIDHKLIVLVIAIGKRNESEVYREAGKRK